jgi:hypothetical protein
VKEDFMASLDILSKEDLLKLRVRLKTALKNIGDARKEVVDGYSDGSKYAFYAELCGAASAVKGAADIFMAAAEKLTPGGRYVGAAYSFSTASIDAYSKTGLGRAIGVEKMGEAVAKATGFGAKPGALMSGAKVMRTIGVGTAKTVEDISGGEYVGAAGAHVEQFSNLVKLGGETEKLAEQSEMVATVLEGGQDILTGIERVHQSVEEMKRLQDTETGALHRIDANLQRLNRRLSEVEREIARRNSHAAYR